MKRAVVTGIVCALLVAGVAWATQTWRDNESMGGFSLTDPTHAGGGPLCAQYDNTGKLTSAGAPCGAGLGGSAGVSSVTGTALRVSALPTTGAVVVDTIGGFYSGATSGGNEDLGALTSGVDEIIHVGRRGLDDDLCSDVANEVQIGAAPRAAVSRSPSAFTFGISAANQLNANGTIAVGTHVSGAQTSFFAVDTTANIAQLAQYPAAGTNVAQTFIVVPKGTGFSSTFKSAFSIFNTDYAADQTNYEELTAQANGASGFNWTSFASGTGVVRPVSFITGANANQLLLNVDGTNTMSSLAAGGMVKALSASSPAGKLALAVAGADFQLPLVACTDYVSLDVDGSGTTDLGGETPRLTVICIENTAAMRGDIVATEIVAPGTPASGILTCYGDNSSLNWACKDQLGNVKHGVRTTTATASQFFTAVSDSGQFSRAQPSYSDISGSPPDQGQVWVDAADAGEQLARLPSEQARGQQHRGPDSDNQPRRPVAGERDSVWRGGGAFSSYYTQQWATVLHPRPSARREHPEQPADGDCGCERHGSGMGGHGSGRNFRPDYDCRQFHQFPRLLLRVRHAGPRRLERQRSSILLAAGAVRAPS